MKTEVYHLPKLVIKELKNLLKFCEDSRYDSVVDIQNPLSELLENIERSKLQGYISIKN